MSSREKIYDALIKGVTNSLTLNWEPEWSDFVGPFYESFAKDMLEDLGIMALTPRYDKETKELLPDAEVTLSGWISDEDDSFSKPFLLSDILFDLFDNTDEEDFEILLERSIAEARKKIAINKLRRSYP
jgi:hypothetical protein